MTRGQLCNTYAAVSGFLLGTATFTGTFLGIDSAAINPGQEVAGVLIPLIPAAIGVYLGYKSYRTRSEILYHPHPNYEMVSNYDTISHQKTCALLGFMFGVATFVPYSAIAHPQIFTGKPKMAMVEQSTITAPAITDAQGRIWDIVVPKMA